MQTLNFTYFKNICKFIFPSIIGVLLFMIPVQYKGQSMIVVGIFVSYFQSLLEEILPLVMTVMIVIPTMIALFHKLFPIAFIQRNQVLSKMFSTTYFWLSVRLIGVIFALFVYFDYGPEIIRSSDTGGNVLFSLIPTCGMWFFVAGVFLPLITDYGLMDFFSTVLKDIAKPLFCVPGRALIDCFSSWIGSGVCGAYLTISQYEKGCYTAKEAAIIVTNFSIVSISFCSAVAQYIDISSAFTYYYVTVVIAGLICAVVTPRIWPLRGMSNTYDAESGKTVNETVPSGESKVKWGFQLAIQRASESPSFKEFIIKGLTTAFDLISNTAPVLMALGTITLILTVNTPIFNIMSYPFKLLLQLLKVPYAAEAAPAMIIGFADSWLPVIVGSLIPSFYTRFIIGCIAVLQVIYVTEIGAMILTSKVPLNLWQLFIIFMERTLICLPVVILLANIFSIGG